MNARPRTTECPAGHARTPENTYEYTYGGYVMRQCKPCRIARSTMERHVWAIKQQKWARLRAARGEP